MTNRVLLYYQYTSVSDPAAEHRAQRELCKRLDLKGRILVGSEGINGTVAGDDEATQVYIDYMREHPLWRDIVFKVDPCDDIPFPRLRVRVRDEIVTLSAGIDVSQSAPKLTPTELNDLLAADPSVVMFDARNHYESAIGRFHDAVTPPVELFRDLPEVLDDYTNLRDRTVVTYCTGGIRCEKASALMRQRGFRNVYQLDGGIINYAQQYPDGAFEGSVFVFDQRLAVKYGSGDHIGKCYFCTAPTSTYINCVNKISCNLLMLRCNGCENESCSNACLLPVS